MAERVEVYFEDHRESRDLGRLALRGGVVSVAMQYGNGVLQIVAAIVLARLLAPEDFGLFAIVTVLTSFAPLLIDFGLGDATTQKSKITQSQVSSLFWLSSGIGLLIAAIVAACFDHFRAVWDIKPAPGAFTANDAVCQNCQNTDSQHLGRSRHRHLHGDLRFWLLGAGPPSNCKHALPLYCSVARVPMEAWLSNL
jgi:Polysaccharide biosynthesis protein